MFDIGFWEILIIGIIALLVIGPERLPEVARTIGKWVGKAQRFTQSMKNELNSELEKNDLKEALEEPKKALNELQQSFHDSQGAINQETSDVFDIMDDTPLSKQKRDELDQELDGSDDTDELEYDKPQKSKKITKKD
jgi:sec-independent protein translocase protein TatB